MIAEGPELRIFWPGTDELTRSYLPDEMVRAEVHEQAKASLARSHPELRLDGSAKALRIGGDGVEFGLPAAYGYLFTYRTLTRGRT